MRIAREILLLALTVVAAMAFAASLDLRVSI